MFADLALPSRTCPKTLGHHSLGVGGKSATRLSKIILPVHGKAQLQQSFDCRRLACLAREEHRFRRWNRSAFRGIHKLSDSDRKSTRNSQMFSKICRQRPVACRSQAPAELP